MVAADAAEPVGAGVTTGLDGGRFGAEAEGDDGLPDGAAGVVGVDELFGLAPYAIAVAVELIAATLSTASRRRSCPTW